MKIIVGSRGSKLALTQTNWVVQQLKIKNPGVKFEVQIIKTKGDKIQNISLDKIGDKGLFVKEIEEQLLNGKIDMAVHSMKDMPSELPENLKFSNIPKREDYRDVIVLKEGYKSIKELPHGAVIATGSKRRKYQILEYRPDFKVVSIRGNVDTRIRKLKEENLDGIILAAAGINRLNIKENLENIIEYMPKEIMLPAPAQGALALEVKKDRTDLDNIINKIEDYETKIQIDAERAFLDGLNGSCHIPVGAFCEVKGDSIKLEGLFGTEDGKKMIKMNMSGQAVNARKIGYELADTIYMEMNKNEG